MYQLRLFGFQVEPAGIVDPAGYGDVPLTITRQDLSAIQRWIANTAPFIFGPSIHIIYEIWECTGTVPVALRESGSIMGTTGNRQHFRWP